MKQTSVNPKKHTVFRMFIIPLILIMLFQSLLTLGTLVLRRTFGTIQDYSVSMMARTVENRKVILENAMTQRCSSVYEQNHVLEDLLETYLRQENLTLGDVMASKQQKEALLELFFPKCLENLQSSQSTGIFLILAEADMDAAGEYAGFYLRDSNPTVTTAHNTDILFERGAKELARSYAVPLDTCWTTYFRMAGCGQREADAFFYEPWSAGCANPDAETENLGYWSKPFILEDDPNDAHEMITFSVPLRYKGTVYGVMGIEISESFLYDYFPMVELNANDRSGYFLALSDGEGQYAALVGKGVLYNSVVGGGVLFELDETKYKDLFLVKGRKLGSKKIYAVNCPLKLYDDFAPYGEVDWVLLGLETEDDLFGMGRHLYLWIGIAMLLGLIFGVVGIYVTVRYLTRPIQDLARSIEGGSEGLLDFQDTNIREIDGLYLMIRGLTDTLMEEKERYRVVLESAKDTFFTYDFSNQTLDVVNHPTQNGIWKYGESGFFDRDKVYYEDRAKVMNALENCTDSIHLEFRYQFADRKDFEWYEVYGKVIKDADGRRSKLVGVLHNIQNRKQQEALQRERHEKDSVTGFYAYDAGIEKLEQARALEPGGVMLYMLLDKLQQINEMNGIVFGDLILEELGRIVRDSCKKLVSGGGPGTVAIRIDGDECAVWLERLHRKEAEYFVQRFFREVEKAFDPEIMQVRIYAGLALASAEENSLDLIRMAKYAQMQVRENAKGNYLFFEGTSAMRRKLPELEGRDVLSNDYGEEVNLAALAMNLFGRGGNLPAQMTLIMRKIGYHYAASDVLTTVVRQDFHSNYLEYQWHRMETEPPKTVNQYTDKEWEIFKSWLGQTPVHYFTEEESKLVVLQKFLNVSEGQQGVVLPLYDSGNYMGNICILGVDQRERLSAEEIQKLAEVGNVIQSQINQQQHDLASRAKSDFLSRMSHEIRTPMNGIIGMTAIALQKDQSKERIMDCLGKIQNSSRYLLGLINDILDMSKIESGKMHLEYENFDLREMIDTIGELVRPQMEAKDISYAQDVKLEHRWFCADKLRISQVLVNLLGNAVKFTAKQGKVSLTVREESRDGSVPVVYFAVKDNGIGIGKEDQERVFRSFEQARDASTVSKQQGTGLGLSISSRLVQLMGSNIELESELGKGSCFSFAIALELGQEEDGQQSNPEEMSFENYRVLVVEDNELNSEIAKCLLEDHGFLVDCVFDGAQAVERIKETEPGTYDVILMDIMMPVMDGLDATRAIRSLDREDCKKIPIIAMSANAFDDDLKKSVECGMNGHLSKPVEIGKLFALLGEILKVQNG